MPEFPKVTRVHEKTVKAVAEGEHKRQRRRSKRGAIVSDLVVVRVDSRVWDKARELAAKPSHIQIINETLVIVWNHPAPWPKREE